MKEIRKIKEEVLNLIENKQKEYIDNNCLKFRKDKSQFFTNNDIAKIMVKYVDFNKYKYSDNIDILEPSAGFGMLAMELLFNLVDKTNIKNINLFMYEIDCNIYYEIKNIFDFVRLSLSKIGVNLNCIIFNQDFITFNNNLNTKYDIIISNPPYSKIKKDSSLYLDLKNLNIEIIQPNLYQIFIIKSLKLLKLNGQYICITPRNYLVGKYTKNLREWILNNFSIVNLHSFKLRNIFKEVNQEVIISRIINSKNDYITISNEYGNLKLKFNNIILDRKKLMIGIPLRDKTLKLISNIKYYGCKLSDMNIKCSVGPIVQFRNLEYLSEKKEHDKLVPFLIASDIKNNNILFENRKKNYKYISSNNIPRLIENKNMVLIRKFVAKEDKDTIIGSVVSKKYFESDKIGIDSNILIFNGRDRELSIDECYGLYAYLTSKYFKEYYLMFNGTHTINILEINSMYFPCINTLSEIGKDIILGNEIDGTIKKYMRL